MLIKRVQSDGSESVQPEKSEAKPEYASPPQSGPFYAFVKYYSSHAAKAARRDLAGRFFLKGQIAKVC